jgi:putative oxidoreductase
MSDAASWILLIGRILFALSFFVAGLGFHVTKGQMAVGYSRQIGFPFPAITGWPTGIWLLAGALSIGLGIFGDIGALMVALFVVPAAWWFHAFWKLEDESQKQMQQLLFWRNVSFLGAALIVFVLFAVFGHDLALTVTDPVFDLRK